MSVLPDDVGLRRVAVAHVGNIVNIDGCAIHRLNRQIIQFSNRLWAGVEFDLMFKRTELRSARGENQILGADRIHEIHGSQVLRLKSCGIDVHRY